MSDIHGDFETFDKALNYISKNNADVLTINGDLIGSVFEKSNDRNDFIQINNALQNLMPQIYKNTQGKIHTFHDAAGFLKSDNVKAQPEIKKLAQDYLDFEKKARKNMISQYKKFKERFDDLEQKVILVPGNWEGKCIDEVLRVENIHNKYYEEVNDIKFIGYGGAPLYPVEIPSDLITDYNSDELFNHLCKFEDAEIVLTHNVPRGFEGEGSKYPGEYSLLAYLYRNEPSLILTGHLHEPFVVKEPKTGTFIANPGNLGRYNDTRFGTFLELEIDENTFVKPLAFHQVNGNSIEKYPIKLQIPQ